LAVAALASLLALEGCSSTDITAADVVSVGVSPPTATIFVDESVDLSATPRDGSGNSLAGRTVVWRSLSPAVAPWTARAWSGD
jgi:hypothetical protein